VKAVGTKKETDILERCQRTALYGSKAFVTRLWPGIYLTILTKITKTNSEYFDFGVLHPVA
jgi:hypothetical protein